MQRKALSCIQQLTAHRICAVPAQVQKEVLRTTRMEKLCAALCQLRPGAADMSFSIRRRPESEAHALHRTLSGSVSHAVRDKVRRSVCRPELSGFGDCAVSAAPGIINIPPQSGGYFRFGHSPNTTGNAQVRFLLACQPRIGLLATRKRVSGIVKTYLITFSIHL